MWSCRISPTLLSLPSQCCDIERDFCTGSVRASAPASSGKLTRAEKGSVSTGGSAETRLQHQKGEDDVKLLKNPNTNLIINHWRHHSFIQTRQLRAKNRREKQKENLVLRSCFSELDAKMATPQLSCFRHSASLLDGAVCSNMIQLIIHLGKKHSAALFSAVAAAQLLTEGQ